VQPNGTSIQELLEEVLATIHQRRISVTGAGRTDAGVHALAQIAHFTLDGPPPSLRSLNGLLPADIRVFDIAEVSDDFHARFSATGKIYHYHLWTDPVQSPFKRLYSLHHTYPLDREAVESAISHLLGTHDFTSFANESGAKRNPIRTIDRIDLVDQPGGLRLEFEGKSFLYKMVRNLVGTLLEVGAGKRSPNDIPTILAAGDRRAAGKAAAPHGLFLVEVHYDEL
jgi:tRNA pseudouridine38-40 synthase